METTWHCPCERRRLSNLWEDITNVQLQGRVGKKRWPYLPGYACWPERPLPLRKYLCMLNDVVALAKEASTLNSPHARADWPENRKVAITTSSLSQSPLTAQVLSLHLRSRDPHHSRLPFTTYVPAARRAARRAWAGSRCPGSPGLYVAANCDAGSSSLPPLPSTRVRPRLSCWAGAQPGSGSYSGGGESGCRDPPPSVRGPSPLSPPGSCSLCSHSRQGALGAGATVVLVFWLPGQRSFSCVRVNN